MKMLTLHQPWASAIPLGLKAWETRSWGCRYRGPLGIHAAKTIPAWAREFAVTERMLGRLPAWLPRGAVVAVVDLVEVIPTEEAVLEIGAIERLYGDYAPGRLAWKLINIRPLAEPVPCKGKQGLWRPSLELETAIWAQVESA